MLIYFSSSAMEIFTSLLAMHLRDWTIYFCTNDTQISLKVHVCMFLQSLLILKGIANFFLTDLTGTHTTHTHKQTRNWIGFLKPFGVRKNKTYLILHINLKLLDMISYLAFRRSLSYCNLWKEHLIKCFFQL